jgi:hypothetical protein
MYICTARPEAQGYHVIESAEACDVAGHCAVQYCHLQNPLMLLAILHTPWPPQTAHMTADAASSKDNSSSKDSSSSSSNSINSSSSSGAS